MMKKTHRKVKADIPSKTKHYHRTPKELERDKNLIALWLIAGYSFETIIIEHRKHCQEYELTITQLRHTVKQIQKESVKDYLQLVEDNIQSMGIAAKQLLGDYLKDQDPRTIELYIKALKTQTDVVKDFVKVRNTDSNNNQILPSDQIYNNSDITIPDVLTFIQGLDGESLIEMVLLYQHYKGQQALLS